MQLKLGQLNKAPLTLNIEMSLWIVEILFMFQHCWEKEKLIGLLEHWKTKIFYLGIFFSLDKGKIKQKSDLFLDKIFIFSFRAKLLVTLSRAKDW